MQKRFLIYIIILILLSQLVLGLGVRPAKKYFDFQPNEIMQGSFKIINNDNKDLDLFIYTQGDLAEYIELEEEDIKFSDGEKVFKYKVKFPSQLQPGETIGEIVVTETIPDIRISGTQVSANIKLIYKVIVKTPSPDKFVEASLKIIPIQKNIDILTTINNKGKQDIDEASSDVTILDIQKEISKLSSEKVSLKAGEQKELRSTLSQESIQKGSYKAMASVNYDNKVIEIIKEFKIGEPKILINYFDKYFVVDKINELNIEYKNEWNQKLKEIYTDIKLFKDGKEILSMKTISFEIEPWSNKKVTSYLDARGIEPGNYQMDILIHHGERIDKTSELITIMTQEEYEKINKSKGLDTVTILIIAFVLLFITVIVFFLYVIKLIKKKK